MYGIKGLFFDNGDGSGDDPNNGTPPESKEPKWTPDMQAEFDRRAAALKKSALEEGRKKAAAEFEATKAAEKEAADKKALEEQGKFKEAAELAEKARLDAEKKLADAEARARDLQLKDSFRSTVTDLGLKFVNKQAEQDAFAALAKESVDDEAGMKKAVETLIKERAYYFGETQEDEPEGTDARERGKFQKTQKTEEQRKKELEQRLRIPRPR